MLEISNLGHLVEVNIHKKILTTNVNVVTDCQNIVILQLFVQHVKVYWLLVITSLHLAISYL
jgi:hypothetical protein